MATFTKVKQHLRNAQHVITHKDSSKSSKKLIKIRQSSLKSFATFGVFYQSTIGVVWFLVVQKTQIDGIKSKNYKKILIDGRESRYGSAYKRTLNYKGKVVEVTFQKLKDGVISISNAWVK